jgi:DNA-binding HxlR family transcriptional regulator
VPNPESDPIRQSPVPMDQCGAALAFDVIPDRWSWLILREMFYGVSRFADIQADIGIPKSVLSGRLAQIVDNGLARKVPYREGSSRTRYAYVMTQKGRELIPAMIALMQWGDKHLKNGKHAIALSDKRTGDTLKMGLVPEGGALPLRRLTFKPIWNKHDNKV